MPDPFTVSDARYARDSVAIRIPSNDGWMTRAGRLARALKCRWSNRERAYITSHSKARRLAELFAAGWDGGLWGDLQPPNPAIVY